jgi:putative nucleotidyltransferase with HDIG domain
MSTDKMQSIEAYAREVMASNVAHDFKHADRVRNWALRIARGEGYPRLDLVEAAALLHDIGLQPQDRHTSTAGERRAHAERGADMAAAFLRERHLFPDDEIEQTAEAIRRHNWPGQGEPLLDILRDGDAMDMLGAVGLMRAFTSKAMLPEYDPQQVKGQTWGWTTRDFARCYAAGQGVGPCIVDQINMQIAVGDDLRTATARELARPLVQFMNDFVLQLESEIEAARRGTTWPE